MLRHWGIKPAGTVSKGSQKTNKRKVASGGNQPMRNKNYKGNNLLFSSFICSLKSSDYQ